MYLNILGFCLFAFKAILLKATRLQLKKQISFSAECVSVWEKEWGETQCFEYNCLDRWSGLTQTAQPLDPGGSLWIPSRKCQMGCGSSTAPTAARRKAASAKQCGTGNNTAIFLCLCPVSRKKRSSHQFCPLAKTYSKFYVMSNTYYNAGT